MAQHCCLGLGLALIVWIILQKVSYLHEEWTMGPQETRQIIPHRFLNRAVRVSSSDTQQVVVYNTCPPRLTGPIYTEYDVQNLTLPPREQASTDDHYYQLDTLYLTKGSVIQLAIRPLAGILDVFVLKGLEGRILDLVSGQISRPDDDIVHWWLSWGRPGMVLEVDNVTTTGKDDVYYMNISYTVPESDMYVVMYVNAAPEVGAGDADSDDNDAAASCTSLIYSTIQRTTYDFHGRNHNRPACDYLNNYDDHHNDNDNNNDDEEGNWRHDNNNYYYYYRNHDNNDDDNDRHNNNHRYLTNRNSNHNSNRPETHYCTVNRSNLGKCMVVQNNDSEIITVVIDGRRRWFRIFLLSLTPYLLLWLLCGRKKRIEPDRRVADSSVVFQDPLSPLHPPSNAAAQYGSNMEAGQGYYRDAVPATVLSSTDVGLHPNNYNGPHQGTIAPSAPVEYVDGDVLVVPAQNVVALPIPVMHTEKR